MDKKQIEKELKIKQKEYQKIKSAMNNHAILKGCDRKLIAQHLHELEKEIQELSVKLKSLRLT